MTVKDVEGSTGSEIENMVLKSLDDEGITRRNLIYDLTDGCRAMLERFKGYHTVLM